MKEDKYLGKSSATETRIALGQMKRSISISIVLSLMLTATDWMITSPKEFTATSAVAAPTKCVRCHRLRRWIRTFFGPIIPTRPDPFRIIRPYSTLLLSDKPMLRWKAVPGATSYTLSVEGPEVNWKTDVSTTEVIYSGEPLLRSGKKDYSLTVEANTGESMEATFGLLDENQAQRLRVAAERLNRQNLADEAKNLALADLYIQEKLIAEAIDLLQASVAKGSKTAAVYDTLGELYGHVGLLDQAEENYLQAVNLAASARDLEGQAAAAARLGEVYKTMGKPSKALRWYKEAQASYRALDNLQRAQDMQQRQKELEELLSL